MLRVALKMLLGDRAKYVGLLFGITFTSFLVTFAASYFCGFMTRGFALIAENAGRECVVRDVASQRNNRIEYVVEFAYDVLRARMGAETDRCERRIAVGQVEPRWKLGRISLPIFGFSIIQSSDA